MWRSRPEFSVSRFTTATLTSFLVGESYVKIGAVGFFCVLLPVGIWNAWGKKIFYVVFIIASLTAFSEAVSDVGEPDFFAWRFFETEA